MATTGVGCELDEQFGADPSADNELLFGISHAEIVDVADHYGLSAELLAGQLSAPFDCERYGDLCNAVGQEAAADLIMNDWSMLVAGEERKTIEAAVDTHFGDAFNSYAAERPTPLTTFEANEVQYYSGSNLQRARVTAWIYWLPSNVYQKGIVESHRYSGGSWQPTTEPLVVSVTAERRNNGNLHQKSCSSSVFGTITSCSRSFVDNGDFDLSVRGSADGHSVYANADWSL